MITERKEERAFKTASEYVDIAVSELAFNATARLIALEAEQL